MKSLCSEHDCGVWMQDHCKNFGCQHVIDRIVSLWYDLMNSVCREGRWQRDREGIGNEQILDQIES